MTTGRVPDLQEVAEDLGRIEERLARMEDKLDARYVPRELYEARHTALRSEIALEVASIKARQDTDRASFDSQLLAERKQLAAAADAADRKINAVESALKRDVSAIDRRTQWMFGIISVPVIGAVVVVVIQGLPS